MELNLWNIEDDLRALVDLRDETETGPFDGSDDERRAALAQLDVAYHDYIHREITKVDGCRSFWRTAETAIENARAEAKRQMDRVKSWEAKFSRLKAMIASVMDERGLKKLEGKTGSFLLKTNGGKQPVIVTDPALVPDEFCEVTVTMSAAAWAWAQRLIASDIASPNTFTARVGPRTPRLELIRTAMEERCEMCRDHAGTVIIDGRRDTCFACGGTGLAGVPGAYLEARQKHVECR